MSYETVEELQKLGEIDPELPEVDPARNLYLLFTLLELILAR